MTQCMVSATVCKLVLMVDPPLSTPKCRVEHYDIGHMHLHVPPTSEMAFQVILRDI